MFFPRCSLWAALLSLWLCAWTGAATAQNTYLLATDYERPYFYVIDQGDTFGAQATLQILDAQTGALISSLPVGTSTTDLTVNYGEDRLYISNWQSNSTQVVDLNTLALLPPLDLGTDVYKINAGRAGRVYFEGEDQWVSAPIADTTTGTIVGELPWPIREGDAEIDTSGDWLYHCDNNSSGAHISKYDISTDLPIEIANSNVHGFGSRNLVLSGDGSRLFWQGYVYDSDLNELSSLGQEIYVSSFAGDFVVSETSVINTRNGLTIHSFATPSRFVGFAGDQSHLFRIDPISGDIETMAIGDVAGTPSATTGPVPADSSSFVLPLQNLSWSVEPLAVGYQVYFGTDAAAVAAADESSPLYLGEVQDTRIDLNPALLSLGETYYWRVDARGMNNLVTGAVWSFNVAPLIANPYPVQFYAVRDGPAQTLTVSLGAEGVAVPWSITEDTPWLSVNISSGMTPSSIEVTVDPAGLVNNSYTGQLNFQSGTHQFMVPVELKFVSTTVSQMLTDFERPYVYALNPGDSGQTDAYLLFINTRTEQVEKVLPIGANPTDMTINTDEDRLYVTNWHYDNTQVVDLSTQQLLPPLQIGTDVFKINAGRGGRIYFEEEDQWVDGPIVDTTSGAVVGQLPWPIREGDAEVDPSGSWLYHVDNNISNAHITRYDITTDSPVIVGESAQNGSGSRNLVMSGDGDRLFWLGKYYDADLNLLGPTNGEVFATNVDGSVAVTNSTILGVADNYSIHTFADSSTVAAISGDQGKLYRYSVTTDSIDAWPIEDLLDPVPPVTSPLPADGTSILASGGLLQWPAQSDAFAYRVYIGTDATAVAAADQNSPEYFGDVYGTRFSIQPEMLEPGQTYYWRIDVLSVTGNSTGALLSFEVFSIDLSPDAIHTASTPDGARQIFEIDLPHSAAAPTWSANASTPWIELDSIGGSTPGTLRLAINPQNLSAGLHIGSVAIAAGGANYVLPVEIEIFEMVLSQLVTDFERPFVYGLHAGTGADDAWLVFIGTTSGKVEKAIPIGANPTDMTVHYGENRLYVTNWQNEITRVVDLSTQEEIAPLFLGDDVYKINAGRTGRLYYEEQNQWIDVPIVDTASGQIVGELPFSVRAGDGEIDPTGSYYYHCDSNISNAHITKYDISTDAPVEIAESLQHPYGSRNLVMSGDGSRLFWRGYVYDADLNELRNLSDEIYTASQNGQLAISADTIFNSQSGAALHTFVSSSNIAAFSGDQSQLYRFDSTFNTLEVIPVGSILSTPDPVGGTLPADGKSIVLPLNELVWSSDPDAFHYRVYVGTDPAAVAVADQNSPEYLGEVISNRIELPPGLLASGETYYWRVDAVGFSGTSTGQVISFSVFPMVVAPGALDLIFASSSGARTFQLELSTVGAPVAWQAGTEADWLSIDGDSNGTTPHTLTLTVDPTGLSLGDYAAVVTFEAGSMTYELPVSLTTLDLQLSRMETDYERDLIYALHYEGGINFGDAHLVIYNPESEQIDKILAIGSGATDMTIHYGEGRLYVSNWGQDITRVVDLDSQQEIESLFFGTDVYRINAGRPGRVYYEEEDQWIDVPVVDTATGQIVGQLPFSIREGDGEIDPTGSYYYHSDSGISGAEIIKYDISTDNVQRIGLSNEHPPGSRNLILSDDGQRLFWQGLVIDSELNDLRDLGAEIYASSRRGDLAVSQSAVYNTHTGDSIYNLPFTTTVSAISADQTKLLLFNNASGSLDVVPMETVGSIPSADLLPTPLDGATVPLPLDILLWETSPFAQSYQVYFGTDEAAVTTADPGSSEYLGETTSAQMSAPMLTAGQIYYWRVDVVGFSGVYAGDVWSLGIAPIVVTPSAVSVRNIVDGPAQTASLTVSSFIRSGSNWSVVSSETWLSVTPASGTTPATVSLTIDPAGLTVGSHTASLMFTSGKVQWSIPVELEIFELELTQMLSDFERPWLYGLHRGSGIESDAALVFINTESERIEKVIPIGINPTDMTINYGEGRLYVTNWQHDATRVVDLQTQEELLPLMLGTDVFKINAGRPGRIYYEEEDQWIDVPIVDTASGQTIGELPFSIREGDGEIDPTGSYYYHSDNNISNAHITKFDISTDTPVVLNESLEHSFGSRNLVLSGDGSRLFWRGYVYDADLEEIGNLGAEIYATTLSGELAFSDTAVFNASTGATIYTIPVPSNVMAVSGDQTKLFVYDGALGVIEVIPMSDIAPVPGPGLNPAPGDGDTVVLPADSLNWQLSPLAIGYRVYLGSDAAAVAAADENSPEYLGEVGGNSIDIGALVPGQVYYWRVDLIGFNGVVTGDVWSFTVAPIIVAPNRIDTSSVVGAPAFSVTLSLDSTSQGVIPWTVNEDIPWLSVSADGGTAPASLEVTIDAAGLTEGEYIGVLQFTSGEYSFDIPVDLELVDMALSQMVTDFERPYVYGLHPGSGVYADAFLVFINTDNQQIEKVIPIGINPTDMTINYGEGRLYVTNWQHDATRVVDLQTQEELPPLMLGVDVFKINAGRPGRIYYEEEDQWIDVAIVDTATRQIVGEFPFSIREGDGEIDPTGSYYYHSDTNISNAHISKYDIRTDSPVEVANSNFHGGSRNLVMSGDGSRLFRLGYVYDADLNEIGNLGDEIYATSLRGDAAFSETTVYNSHTGDAVYTLPIPTTIMAVSGDQDTLVHYNPQTGTLSYILMSDILPLPGPGLIPVPADGDTVVLPADSLNWQLSPLAVSYRVYYGSDAAAVAAADENSPEYMGEVSGNSIDIGALDPGQTYYWRVDLVGFNGVVTGDVWSFTIAPIIVAPNRIDTSSVVGAPAFSMTLSLNAMRRGVVPWTVNEDIPWLSVSADGGTAPGSLEVTIDAVGLTEGEYSGVLQFTTGKYSFEIPVDLELIDMALSQMVTDFERPYVYGLHPGSGEFADAFLVFINTDSLQIEKAIPIGINPTDMTIHYGEGRLYVTNWQHDATRVVDLQTQEELPPLMLGVDVFKINAGRPGRIYYEEEDQWIAVPIVDTTTGQTIGALPFSIREGDGEIDPTGSYYYHSDNNISNAHITKFDVSTDTPVVLAESLQHSFGSRNLVLSGDGSRLFWRGYIYDADLNEIGYLGDEIYTTSLRGDAAFSETTVYNGHTGDAVYTLPTPTTVMAVSGDQNTLVLYNPLTGMLSYIPMSDILPLPGPGLNPVPANGSAVVAPLTELQWDLSPLGTAYHVYAGTDANAVAAADLSSPEYMGEFPTPSYSTQPHALDQTYYWRVDIVGFNGVTPGPIWSYYVAPVVVGPNLVTVTAPTIGQPQTIELGLTDDGDAVSWSVTETIDWLSLDAIAGVTPGALNLTVDPTGLLPGLHIGVITFTVGDIVFDVPIEFEIFQLALSQLLTDRDRPYVYGLHAGSGSFNDAFLVFFNTNTQQVVKALPIGINPTDMTINYAEGRLYVTNWLSNATQVVDLQTQEKLPPLTLGTDVFKINAGRLGRIYYEEEDQWIDVPIVDTTTGQAIGEISFSIREGDGEIDPTGSYYYHCDNNISNAHISKYDISTDAPVELAESVQHPYGSRNLVMSGDGSRLFWRGYVYDADLNELINLNDEIYAAAGDGSYAVSADTIYSVASGQPLASLPFSTTVAAESGGGLTLILFNTSTGLFEVIPTSQFVSSPIEKFLQFLRPTADVKNRQPAEFLR